MVVDPVFFRDLAFVVVAALFGATLAWMLRQPLILGYVLGGILIGPFTPGPSVADLHTFEVFAEIGIVLLMFSVGIEFSLRDLLRVKWVALVGGPLGILLTVGLALGAGALLGWPVLQATTIGFVVSVASTMVLARLLIDRGELRSTHGRIMIGIALVEDLAVVVLTVLLPALGAVEPDRLAAVAVAVGKSLLILVPFLYVAARVIPAVMTRVAKTRNDELFLVVVLAIGLGTAAVTQAVGLSVALGAFLAGLIINNSDYAHESLARLLPLRDIFVAFFFVTVGALIDPPLVLHNLPLLGVMLALIVVGKLAVRTAIVRLFGYSTATAALVGVGLAQIGEFSFVLVQVARQAGHVGDAVFATTLAAALLSILVNAVLVREAPRWLRAAGVRARHRPAAATPHARRDHVVLCGFGRVGSAVGEALDTFGIPYAVIERDPDIVTGLRARGVPCAFGDAAHRGLLAWAGVGHAALVIVALPEIDRARRVVKAARELQTGVPVFARAHGRAEGESLRLMGATEVIQPELEASATLIRHTLATVRLPKELTLAYLERFRDAMQTAGADPAIVAHPLPEVREVALGPGPLADQSLREARIRERFGVTVVAVSRNGSVVLNPPPDAILRSGDHVRVFGLPDQLAAFAAAAQAEA
jgi:CPA2 family monovalent cation:H+ antiporter-2